MFTSLGPRKRRVAASLTLVGLLVAMTINLPLEAAVPRVSLGEVSTSVKRSDLDLGAVLRAAVLEQLSTLETPHDEKGPLILSASLVRIDANPGRVTCVVSATLRTAREGNMLAVVEGRAGVVTEAPPTTLVVRRAVEAAAHAAVVRVPDALR
jgi:hypothetical protein